jgi:apolipoprotein N-acyltransferase
MDSLTALAILASAVAFYLSTGLGEIWPLAWLAPAPVLWLAFQEPRRHAFLPAAAAFFLGSLNLFGFLSRILPAPILLVLLVLPALVFGAVVVFAGRAVRTLSPFAAVVAFPAAWTSYEFLVSLVSPHGTALSLAYSQAEVQPLVQVVSVTGLWGLTFLLTLVPSAIALALTRRAKAPLGGTAVLLAMVVALGAVRLHQGPMQPTVRVGLAVTDRDIGRVFDTEDRATALAIAHGYRDRIAALSRDGARVVVLPEKMTGVTPASGPEVAAALGDQARLSHVALVAGLNRVGIEPPRNVALVWMPDGRQIIEYDKHHMLPGPETGYLVGRQPGLFTAEGQAWGVAICKDMDFQGWSRRYGDRGVRILAVPAWDFVIDGRLHFRMALVRSVENGFALVRAAEQGLLTVSDGYGRIVASMPSGSEPDARLVADVAPGPGATFYTRGGDWFGWLSVVVAGAIGVSGVRLGRQR